MAKLIQFTSGSGDITGGKIIQLYDLDGTPVFINGASAPTSQILGIKRLEAANTSPTWERTDGAIGLTATASVGATMVGHSDFDKKPIYREIERVRLGNDVMVKIPKFYYYRYMDNGYQYIKISPTPAQNFILHPAFFRANTVYDYIYVGAYKTSGSVTAQVSVTNASPLVNQTRNAFRNGAKNKGTGWDIIDYATVSAIQMLILVEFANNDVQTVIGPGYSNTNNSAAIKTGSCDNVANLTGRNNGNATADKNDVIWRGIEGFWGNVWEWVDGLNFNNGVYLVSNNPSVYKDDDGTGYSELSYRGLTNWNNTLITGVGFDVNNPWAMMPSAASGSTNNTYYSDGVWSSTGWRVFTRGGHWIHGASAGLFAATVSHASSGSYSYIGSRLQCLQ